ncbi:unannotated protein [freshwater metagenome]|uniref:Unannotated protein n=1 Tax=freshwater metagenome TaxID=449393 RepID=A0A6J7IJL9_9ZZZZ|nr:hypothetical protein [Actinomycetota bacterium]
MSLIPLAQGGMHAAQGMQDRFGGPGGPPQGGGRPGGFDHMGGHGVDEASFWIVSSVALALLIALVVLAVLLLRELRRQGSILAPRPAAPAAVAVEPSPTTADADVAAASASEAPTVAQPPQPGS